MRHPPYELESHIPSPPDVNVVAVDDDDGGGKSKALSNTSWRNYSHDPPSAAAAATGRCSSFNSTFSFLSSHQNTNTYNDTSPAASASAATLLCFNAPSWRWITKKKQQQRQGNPETDSHSVSFMAAAEAASEDLTVNVLLGNKKKQLSGQQKKEELEREVKMLQKLLSQEEKVHEILQSVHDRDVGSSISIPNFLPPKMKELLAELAMVEEEIARLESQISQLQTTLEHEQESRKDNSRLVQKPRILKRIPEDVVYSARPSPLNRHVPERMGFETKALHFISKAIKGDYNLKDFRLMDKSGNPRWLFSDQKENQLIEEAKITPEKFSTRSGSTLRASYSSPLRDLRHPTPKPKERRYETPLKTSSKAEEEKPQKWEPNKLSESIMKCLNFIYIRLLRTSRAMEIEKSGATISRSLQLNSTLNSRSFRAETSLTSKSNGMSQRESRQADPYGVFESEDSIPRDIGPYKNLVRFTTSSLDPKCISSSSSVPLLKKLRELMTQLQRIDLRFLSNQQKLAFWVNMYNACIMHGYLQYGVPSTAEKLLALLNKATLNVGGNTINAQAIEHFILRKPSSSNNKEIHWKGEKDSGSKEAMVRELYGLESVDPNITFALCCGTRSSPAVKIYTAEGVTNELERSKLEYLQASIVVTSSKKIAFPEPLLRNGSDFLAEAGSGSLVEWVCQQLPTSGTLRKSLVECFRGHNSNSGQAQLVSVEKIPYDYEFQYLLAM
ncbi:hypothetical protein CRG98_015189 [Punica granatum]|nr:hypothetical protein CRG98_015189 [Punica granatum]